MHWADFLFRSRRRLLDGAITKRRGREKRDPGSRGKGILNTNSYVLLGWDNSSLEESLHWKGGNNIT